ncbi:hypothetical protein [Gloeobacter violaceus]|uniref:hypothetical protein n=1 Tax=Gloeobacter violaceus TaxID=33072 RepID=UPI0013E89C59|nr:hypothetical protein [Gloeobacter violaceus]
MISTTARVPGGPAIAQDKPELLEAAERLLANPGFIEPNGKPLLRAKINVG